MSLKCIIIDDDQYAIDALAKYIGEMPNLSVYQTYIKPLAALTQIKKEDEIDFIFLDIEMPDISGLELAERLRDKTKFLIFITSHPSYALKAFDLNANQYLLKPITFAKFALAIDYLLKNTTENVGGTPKANVVEHKTAPKRRLQFIKGDHKNSYHQLDADEIVYIEAAKNYVNIYTTKEKYVTHMGLNQIEAALGTADFIRIAKSYIVAKSAIKKVEGSMVRLKNNDNLFVIGDIYKSDFDNFMRENMVFD